MSSFPSIQQMSDLWQYIEKLFRNVSAVQVSGEHWKRVRMKFNQIVTYLTCIPEIAGSLFQKEMINQEELESIQSLNSTPIRASTELLTVLMRKSKYVYDFFLQTLLKTNQSHIHQLLVCEIEDCDMEHSRVIRSNYSYLIEHLNSADGLVNHLIANNVLNLSEAAEINSEVDPYKKNEKLLPIISKKDPKYYQEFLKALEKSNQGDVRKELEKKNQSARQNVAQTETKVFKVSENFPTTNPSRRPPPPPTPPHPHRRASNPCSQTETTAIQTIPKRISVDCLGRIFSKLNDDLQASISVKVVTQKTKDSIVHSCIAKTFENFEKLKSDSENEMNFVQLMQSNLQGEPSSSSVAAAAVAAAKEKRGGEKVQQPEKPTVSEQEFQKLKQENEELRKKLQKLEPSKNPSPKSPPPVLVKSQSFEKQQKDLLAQIEELTKDNLNLKQKIQELEEASKVQLEKLRKENNDLEEENKQLRIFEGRALEFETENHKLSEMLEDLLSAKEPVEEPPTDSIYLRDGTKQSGQVQKDSFRYIETPSLEETIGRDEPTGSPMANGLSRVTILENELYIVAQEYCRVNVYGASDLCFKREWYFPDVQNVEDIVSCRNNRCLYIVFWNSDMDSEEIIWCDPTGKLLMRWRTGERQGRLSITHRSQLLLTVNEKNRLHEYSPDGRPLRQIQLRSPINSPQHSLEFEDGLYVVSYGSKHPSNPAHGVCLVNSDGEVLKSFSVSRSHRFQPLNLPVYLAVDENRNILVADLNNNRVLLLNSELKLMRKLITEEHGLQFPRRICLNVPNGRLIVASGIAGLNGTSVGQVLVFRVGVREDRI